MKISEEVMTIKSDIDVADHTQWTLKGLHPSYHLEAGTLRNLMHPSTLLCQVEGHGIEYSQDESKVYLQETYRRIVGAAIAEYGSEILPEATKMGAQSG